MNDVCSFVYVIKIQIVVVSFVIAITVKENGESIDKAFCVSNKFRTLDWGCSYFQLHTNSYLMLFQSTTLI